MMIYDKGQMIEVIRLQGYGLAHAKPAESFQVGDRMIWNYGETSTVTSKGKETAATITFELDGKYNRKFKKTRLVAVSGN